MATPTSYQDSASATRAVPVPTHPVARQPIETDNPEFDWTPVPDTEQYRLQIAATDDFDTIHYDETVDRKTQIPLDSVLPMGATTGCWRVRAETSDWTSPWSDPAQFSIASAEAEPQDALLVDASPVPLHPTEQTSTNRNATTFAWDPIPEASGYQLQVSRNEDFSDADVNLTLDQVTSLTLYKTLPEEGSPLYWRVRCLFSQSTPGPWSDPATFEVSPAPAPETEPTSEPEATEGTSTEAAPLAAGPAQQSRTSSTLSLTVAVISVISFLLTIFLVAFLG